MRDRNEKKLKPHTIVYSNTNTNTNNELELFGDSELQFSLKIIGICWIPCQFVFKHLY